MHLSYELIIDAHEDLAWNMVNLDRDHTRLAYEIRESEMNSPIPAYDGDTLLAWPQYQEGNVVEAVNYYEKAYAIDMSFTSYIWAYKDILRQLGFN